MERIQKLWEHPLYQEQFQKLQKGEQNRIFCNHTLAHFLDVARLTYIYSLESGAGLDKELIYAAALLHDIGRWQQLSQGIPHDKAGAALAGYLLPECGFNENETATIQNAILHHRTRRPLREGQVRADDLTSPSTEAQIQTDHSAAPSTEAQTQADALAAPATEAQIQSDDSAAPATEAQTQADVLAAYLRQADKRCRCCFACDAAGECNWSEEQKNHQIIL